MAVAIFCGSAQAQMARVRSAGLVEYPSSVVDGNSPSVWVDGTLRVYTSTGDPLAMAGPDIFRLQKTDAPIVTPKDHYPLWIESAWRDADGTIYAWYHHEPSGVCGGGKLTAPQIGALVSTDGGLTFKDLGIVLATGDPFNCEAGNGFFAGGHGDFSVIPDREQKFFYFLFGNYGGPRERQGVATARMPFEFRANPSGTVRKYYDGAWDQPGVGGLATPIYRVTEPWDSSKTDALWGPAIHWNTHINKYVAVFNRSCCGPEWPQEGIYLSTNADLSQPEFWSLPFRILDAASIGFAPGYYPQVVGLEPGGTDSVAGRTARLFVKGISKWEIDILTDEEAPSSTTSDIQVDLPAGADQGNDQAPRDPGAPGFVARRRRP